MVGSGAELDFAGGPANGAFYGYDSNGNEDLYSIDLSTGAATAIGDTNVSCGDNSGQLVCDADTLCLMCLNGDRYSINPLTAAATYIGDTGVAITGAGFVNGIFNGLQPLDVLFRQRDAIATDDSELHNAAAQSNRHRRGSIACPKLEQNVGNVPLDRALTDFEIEGNLLVAPAGCQELQDGHFALRQFPVSLARGKGRSRGR